MATPYTHREINFDAALEGYVRGNINAQALARAVDLVIGSTVPLDPEYSNGNLGANELDHQAGDLR
jgi:hypothetical protein